MKSIIHDVTFVYDFANKHNTWNQTELMSLLMPKDELSKYNVTEDRLVSLKGCNGMGHPLLGKNTKRYGWDAMRNSDEWSFTVGGYKSVVKDKKIEMITT